MQLNYDQLDQTQTSFQLFRTNPKLTGNVKISVNSEDQIFLDSIESNSELASSRYKRFSIYNGKSHAANIFNFFTDTPNNTIFSLNEGTEPNKVSSQYKDQYSFDYYYSGIYYSSNKFYEEQFNMFAPIYLNQQLPNYFIILKVPHPINERIDQNKQKYPFNSKEYFNYFLKNGTIVHTFDLRSGTSIGNYIRQYLSLDQLPQSSLTVRFEEDVLSTWNGISTETGVINSRGELLSEFLKTGYPIKYFEKFITEGFERNSIIHPHIFNLSFLFNDETSDVYDFNRYIGFYVNDIPVDSFSLNFDQLVETPDHVGNSIQTQSNKDNYISNSIKINRNSGVNIPFYNNKLNLEDLYSACTYTRFNNNMWQNIDNNESFISCVQDSYNQFHKINGIDTSLNIINIDKKSVNSNQFYNPGSNFIIDEGRSTSINGFSTTYVQIYGELSHTSKIIIYHPLGSKGSANNYFDEIVIINTSSSIGKGEYYYEYDQDNQYGGDVYYVNGTGTIFEITNAISTLINQIKAPIQAFSLEDTIVIKSTLAGNYDNLLAIEYTPYQYTHNFKIEGEELINIPINFKGGTVSSDNRLVISSDHLDKINSNIDNIIVKTYTGWSKIQKVSQYAEAVNDIAVSESIIQARNNYLNNIVLVLEKGSPNISNRQFNIKRIFNPNVSLMSFFPIKDFDYDFYSSLYTTTPIWEVYQYFYIPQQVNILQPGVDYEVIGSGEIEVEGNVVSTNSSPPLFTVSTTTSYTVLTGEVAVIYSNTPNNNAAIHDENNEIKNFSGFFSLRDESLISQSDTDLYTYKNKITSGRLNTEYDFHRENFTQDFAYLSKLQPYICKFGLGKDARDNPYRLNTDYVFGVNNFSPNHFNKSQDPINLSHEWYYIEASYPSINSEPNLLANNYNYFNYNIDINKLLTDPDAFNNYFKFTPMDQSNNYLDDTQDRFSVIEYDSSSGLNQTFFRGAKIRFKDVQNKDILNVDGKPVFKQNSRRFNNYKFSVLLKPIKENIKEDYPPISFKFIQSEFGFIILVIELRIGSSDQVGDFDENVKDPNDINNIIKNRSDLNGDYRISFNQQLSNLSYLLLYTLSNKKYNNKQNRFSNIKLPFSIDLSQGINYPIVTQEDSNYNIKLQDEIKNFYDSALISAHISQNNQDYFLGDLTTSIDIANPVKSVSKNSIRINSAARLVDEDLIPSISVPSFDTRTWRDFFSFYQLAAGEDYFSDLFSKISFAQIKEYINNFDSVIPYYSYDKNGNLIDSNNYYAEIIDPHIVDKNSEIVARRNDITPEQFDNKEVVDFDYIRVSLNESQSLYRYNGNYDPIFRNLFKFSPKFKFKHNKLDDINFANIKINTQAKDFGLISNLSFLKISDQNILKLENNEKFDPRFELVDEIPIDQKDFFIFRSNWDYGFHQKHIDKSNYIPVAGTLRIEEDNSFVGKSIKLPRDFAISNFSSERISDQQNINIELTNQYDSEILYREREDSFEGLIDVNEAITRYLINDGFGREFYDYIVDKDEFVGSISLNEYIREYIRINILKLVNIDQIFNFKKIEKQQQPDIQVTKLTYDEALQSYTLSKDVNINKLERLVLYFSISKSDEGLIKYNPIINITTT
jgi:hypothetical protein